MLPTTTSMLLQSLLDGRGVEGDETWTEFDARYRPVLFSFARRLGLSEDDAGEVAQDALVAFVEEFRAGRFDRERGRLRSWLFAIARTRVERRRRILMRQEGGRHGGFAAQSAAGGDSLLAELPGEDELSALWEAEWREALLRKGIARLRATQMSATTLRIFELLCLEGRSPSEVARQFDTTLNAVYLAKFRALERLREVLVEIEEEWE